MGVFIKILTGELKDRTYDLGKVFRIGRSNENDLVLTNTKISGKHAEILLDNETYVLKDLSKNGTFVKSKRIEKQILDHKMVFSIGDIRVEFNQQQDTKAANEKVESTPQKDNVNAFKKKGIPPARMVLYGVIFAVCLGLLVLESLDKSGEEDDVIEEFFEKSYEIAKVGKKTTIIAQSPPMDSLLKGIELLKLGENLFKDKTQDHNLYKAIIKWGEGFAVLDKYKKKPDGFDKHKNLHKTAQSMLDHEYEVTHRQARVLYKQKNYREAVELLRHFMEIVPNQKDYRHQETAKTLAVYSGYAK